MNSEIKPIIQVLIFNDLSSLNVLLYQDQNGAWQLPSTEIQDGENAFEAAARATKEDCGVVIDINRCKFGLWEYNRASKLSNSSSFVYSGFIVYHFRNKELKHHNDNSRWFSLTKLPNSYLLPTSVTNYYLENRKTNYISILGIALVALFSISLGAVNSQKVLSLIAPIDKLIGLNLLDEQSLTSTSKISINQANQANSKTDVHYSSCPSVQQVQQIINDNKLKPGSNKLWRDSNGVQWQIGIPKAIQNPPTVDSFYIANWTNQFTIFCGYSAVGSKTAIFANGQFNTKKPSWAPWSTTSDGSGAICSGDPLNCTFKTILPTIGSTDKK